jgi:hypothetical protein
MAVRNGLLDSYGDALHERTSPGEMPRYWYSPYGECAAEWKTTGPLLSKVVGAGRPNEGLRATWQEELQTAHDVHDDMFVYREDRTASLYITINTSTISSTGCWHMACDHLSNWDSFPLRFHP